MHTALSVALYGATGALGREILSCLEEDGFNAERLTLYGTELSAGEELLFGHRVLMVKLTPVDPPPVDLAILAVPPEVGEALVPALLRLGARVVDANPGRAHGLTPALLVPPVNGERVDPSGAYFGAPTQSALLLARVLSPLVRAFGLEEGVVTALESASGQGQRGMEALSREILNLYRKGEVGGGDEGEGDEEEEEVEESPHAHQLAFNAIPQVGPLLPGGRSAAELGIEIDVPRILGLELPLTGTVIQAPWFSSHGLSITVTLGADTTREAVVAALNAEPGLEVAEGDGYPMPFKMVGRDEIAVGRVRLAGRRLSLWVVGDNLRAGAALNVVAMARWVQSKA